MVIDNSSKETGLLIGRYDVFGEYWITEDIEKEDIGPIWAWKILWSGSRVTSTKTNRYGSYTEMGLINLIHDGQFDLIKVDTFEDEQLF